MNIYETIEQLKILPVIKLDSAANSAPLAEALIAGGLPAAEVTFRTDAAEESIQIMSKKYPDMLVGAGTITSVEQAKRALSAGASFLVSAGFNRKVVEYAVDQKVPVFPGVCTPTELMLILEYQLPVAKFFPAEQFGGLKTIKALAAPFPQIKFMPTGGINAQNICDYLAFEKIIACGGSWMVKDAFINNHEFEKITALTREAVTLVRGEA
ncbi:MAG: bifunctional 4-hydroxy-2-oxoglutarate aldolase/2-dehydro-3-deoxy-phosphogluconate aldolase [Clostridiales bacterium]|nr:bifunctional 4-hydroxy-2-oxoglutarate aldolase/2-dehydro-3-deoxy-phosphogluconate aldolase [Clostridiales bacterium]MCD8151671.1 bifunctional 4-hydroxy-2-oxoglutarate aldolase/2-dehydro-3-deoxy-phosphogluconate aldolase [Clostridiales bacterium]MCD8332890.1 bifunctional 4-hydroxy-2-oxoglutarate aldolase/2-dehydro-3-deoxy-phosphogluconate aldolase [Clostridiales bacterium]